MCGCGATKGVESKECLEYLRPQSFDPLGGWEQCFVRSHGVERDIKIFR